MSRSVNLIIIHCSDSPDDLDIGVDEIERWHLERGFYEIGYHFVVTRNGGVEEGRSLEVPGAHARGLNRHSVGLCRVGRGVMDPQQRSGLLELIMELLDDYELEIDRVMGHCELDASKTCPNIDMNELRRELKEMRDGTRQEKEPV